jgi:flagellar M-ring protein FliF
MEQLKSLQENFGGMPRRAQIAILGVIALTAIMLLVITKAAVHTDWVAVQSNAAPEKIGKSQEALQSAGIQTQITGSGSTLEVPSGDASKARVALASAGAGTDSHASYESILDKKSSPIGLTQEQYKLTRQRLLESLIATDLERIKGISSASVRLVLPEDELFSDEESKATASVSVDTVGNGLSNTQSRAIAQLTAGAVKNMKPIDVQIVDEEGNTYSSGNGADEGGFTNSPTAKLDMEDKLSRKLESTLTGKIEEITGVGNAKVLIRTEIDADQVEQVTDVFGSGQVVETDGVSDADSGTAATTTDTTSTTDTTDTTADTTETTTAATDDTTKTATTTPTTTPSTSTTLATAAAGECMATATTNNSEQLAGRGSTSAGTTGAASNTTTGYAGTSAGGSNNNYVKDESSKTCQLNEQKTSRKVAPGTVKAYRVGVIINSKLSKSDEKTQEIQAAVENMLRAYIGNDPDNTIDFSYAPLKNTDDINVRRQKDERRGQLFSYAKWFMLAIGMLGAAFYLRKSLNQRTMELLEGGEDEMLMLERGYDPIPLKELEAAVSAASSMENQKRVELQKRVEGIVNQKPENVALMLRGWLHDEANTRR